MHGRINVLMAAGTGEAARHLRSAIDFDAALHLLLETRSYSDLARMTHELRPHVIIIDMTPPLDDALDAIEKVMAYHPTPLLVVAPEDSSKDISFEAMRRGALDVIASEDLPTMRAQDYAGLREHIQLLSSVTVVRHLEGRRRDRMGIPSAPQNRHFLAQAPPHLVPASRIGVVGIVASTGGPAALATVLAALPPSFPAAVAIIQHLAPGFVKNLTSWLDRACPLPVSLATDGQPVESGTVVVAPDGYHLIADDPHRWQLDTSPPEGGHKPSGSMLLRSIARVCGRRSVGVLLTGMGQDGVAGLAEIAALGGHTITQDEASSVVYGMAKRAQESVEVECELSLERISEYLCKIVREPTQPPSPSDGGPT